MSRCSSRTRFSDSVEAPSASIDSTALLVEPPGLPVGVSLLVVVPRQPGQVHRLQKCAPSVSALVAAVHMAGGFLHTEFV